VSGLADDQNQAEIEASNSDSENDETTKGDTVKKSPTMDDTTTTPSPVDEVNNQTTEVNETVPNETTVEEVKEKPDSDPEPEVKDSAGPIKDKQALIDDDDEYVTANGTSPANQFEIMEPSNTLTRRGSASQKGVSGQLTKLKNFVKMWFGVLVCVILPIAVYVVDIIITTKVIESKGYKHAMVHWQDDTNKNNKPIPKMNTFGFDDYQLKETWFFEVCKILII